MKTSEQINEISKALCAAQQVMRPAIKDSTNPHFKSRYSDLSSIWEAIRIPITSNGLTVLQDIITCEQAVNVTTRIMHISGQWVEFGPLSIPLAKRDAQAIGSATSYAKRYALCAAIGVVSDDDDDGEKAMGRNDNHKQERQDKPRTIDKNQWAELTKLIDQCDPDYQKNLWDYLNAQGIHSYTDLDEKTFQKLKKGCVGNVATKGQPVHAVA